MRDAETVLNIIQERGKRGLPLEDVSRLLYNPTLYLRASARLYATTEAMPPGSTWKSGAIIPPTVAAHRAAFLAHCSPMYIWTNWTNISRRQSFRHIPVGPDEEKILPTPR